MDALISQAAEVLKQNGYKLTKPRRLLLEWFYHCREHATPQELYESLCQESKGIGLTSVYRNLELLVQVGLVRQVCFHDGCQRFEPVLSGDHHHHLICSGCGRVVRFEECNLHELEQRLEQETGYKVDCHMLQVFGTCRLCQQDSPGKRRIV